MEGKVNKARWARQDLISAKVAAIKENPGESRTEEEILAQATAEVDAEAEAEKLKNKETYDKWSKNLASALGVVARAQGTLELARDLVKNHPELNLTRRVAETVRVVADYTEQSISKMKADGTANEVDPNNELYTNLQIAKSYERQRGDQAVQSLDRVVERFAEALAWKDAPTINTSDVRVQDRLSYMKEEWSQTNEALDKLGGVDYLRKFFPDIDDLVAKEKRYFESSDS